MSIHHFEVEDAKKYGVECAVIIRHIKFWLEKNIANKVHFHDGRVWTYNSAEAFTEQFPYLSAKQIYRRLKKLEDDGILLKGNFNEKKYDKTTWYSLNLPCFLISRNREMEFPKSGNGIPEIGKPIPDIKPDINTDVKEKNTQKEKVEMRNASDVTTGIILTSQEKEKSSAKKEKRFTKPTVDEIAEYCSLRDNGIDAERFYDHYQSKGWKIGKSSMRDWKAAVRTWERNRNQNPQKEPTIGRQTMDEIKANADWSNI